MLFTLGIWQLIWIYRTTVTLNDLEDEPPRNPVTKLLLAFFVPFAPPVLIQEKINTLAQWNGGEMPRLAPQNMSDALRELKQLLDDGVLT